MQLDLLNELKNIEGIELEFEDDLLLIIPDFLSFCYCYIQGLAGVQ